jgi:hypothetical protein
MKPGGGKQKGASFEREICVKLSLWVTAGGRKDVFWRSAMSGGRATVRGMDVRQSGDICAVAPEGHVLTDRWYIETKHVRDLNLWGLFTDLGKLRQYWLLTCDLAHSRGKEPMLIAKQNNAPVLVCLPTKTTKTSWKIEPRISVWQWGADVLVFDELLKTKFRP